MEPDERLKLGEIESELTAILEIERRKVSKNKSVKLQKPVRAGEHVVSSTPRSQNGWRKSQSNSNCQMLHRKKPEWSKPGGWVKLCLWQVFVCASIYLHKLLVFSKLYLLIFRVITQAGPEMFISWNGCVLVVPKSRISFPYPLSLNYFFLQPALLSPC